MRLIEPQESISMPRYYETYGEMFGDFIKRMAKFSSVESVLRIINVPYGHYRKVINPNSETNGGNPYYMPVEWLVLATNLSARQEADGIPGDYCMIKRVARDTNGVYLSPIDIRELKDTLSGAAPDILAVLQRITGEKQN